MHRAEGPASRAREGSMKENSVICADGTGNTTIKGRGTNVFKLYEAVDQVGHRYKPGLTPQVALYHDGVGTESVKWLGQAEGASQRVRAHCAQHRGVRAGLGPTRRRGDLAVTAQRGDRRGQRSGSRAARDGWTAARARSGHGATGALVVLALRLGHRHRRTAGPSGVPGRGHARDRKLARGRPQPRRYDRELAVARPHIRGLVAQTVFVRMASPHARDRDVGGQAARRTLFGLLASRPAPAAAAPGAGARLTRRRSTTRRGT